MNFCLQMGDNNLILGQQFAAWCSCGPTLDHFGQAEMFFNYFVELEGKGRTADDVAFLREERAFKNNLLVEQPNGDFACTLLRQYLYSAFAHLVYSGLQLWMFSDDFFLENEDTQELFELNVIPSLSSLQALWELEVKELFQEASITIPVHTAMIKGGIAGYHTENLGHLLCEMQFLQRAYPGAQW